MDIDREGVFKLLDKIYSESDDKKREITFQMLLAIDDDKVKFIFFPPKKYLWEVSASILKQIGFPRLNKNIPLLLEWYQDANWPGRDTITEILRGVNKVELASEIEASIKKADIENDEQWIGGLKFLINELKIDMSLFRDERLVELILSNDY
jgi:hypothetical protein